MDYLIIGLVSFIAIAAHVWLYLWVKFKIDEGVVCKFLEDAQATGTSSAQALETVAAGTQLSPARVLRLCQHSARIDLGDSNDHSWLKQR